MSVFKALMVALQPVLKSPAQINMERRQAVAHNLLISASSEKDKPRLDDIVPGLMQFAQYKDHAKEIEKKMNEQERTGSYLTMQPVHTGFNYLRRYVEEARNAAAYGKKTGSFTLKTSEMPYRLASSIKRLSDSGLAALVAEMEGKIMANDGIDSAELDRMKSAGFKIEIIKDGVPEREYAGSPELDELAEKWAEALRKATVPNSRKPTTHEELMKIPERVPKYPALAGSAIDRAFQGSEDKAFTVDLKDLPKSLAEELLKFEKDRPALSYFVFRTLMQIAKKWFQLSDDDAAKAIAKGWTIIFR